MVAGEDFHQRRLAGAVVAEDAEPLAALQMQRDAVQRGDGAEALDDVGSRAATLAHPRPPVIRRRARRTLAIIATRIAAPMMRSKVKALMP